MLDTIQFSFFIIFILYVFIKAVAYGIYEFKNENNKLGGVVVILFSLAVSILSVFSLFSD